MIYTYLENQVQNILKVFFAVLSSFKRNSNFTCHSIVPPILKLLTNMRSKEKEKKKGTSACSHSSSETSTKDVQLDVQLIEGGINVNHADT